MARTLIVLLLLPLFGIGGVDHTFAQDSAAADSVQSWHEDAWTTIIEKDGVRFSYIFYSKADTHNNGVVLRLDNSNREPVRYDFTVIFRGPSGEATTEVDGTLEAGQMKTGEKDGLFWIPFRNGGAIGEVGLRGINISRISPSDSYGDGSSR